MHSQDNIVDGEIRQQQDRPLGGTDSKQSVEGERNDSRKSIVVWTGRSSKQT